MSDLKQTSVALLEEAIDRKIRNAQKGRDTTLAIVTRVDGDGTTWVRVYGGADETPVRRMTSSAQVGDTLNVVFSGLSCMGAGNVTSPSASVVQVDNVEIAARGAAVAAQAAWAHADDAAVAAQAAWSHADDAADAAEDASRSADSALVQLSIVEDVAGTLDWISKHGSYNLTTDTAVVDGRVYFAYDSSTGDYTPVVSPDPTSNPRTEGWYVLDVADSQSDFIMAHLAVTSRGLWVLPSGIGSAADEQHAAGYKALLSSDGMYVYDSTGALVIKYGQNIEPSTDRPFYIGDPNSTSYILFTPASGSSPSHVSIGGGVSIGSGKTLSELLTAEDITVTQNQTQTGYDVDIAGNTFSLLNGEQGPQGAAGPQGPQGDTGATGATAQWYYGTALTHTSGTAAISTSGTAGVVVGSMYLNTELTLCYKCTAISGSTATWAYAGNLTDGVIENVETYVDDAVGAANQLEQTVYIQATAGTTTAAPPSGWVEETGESTYLVETGGTETWSTPVWTTKPPTYRQQYPVTLVAIQRKRIDGTVTCTAPLIDDTTTVIDGGNIITDSVTANAIDATDLHVSAANVDGTLTASQIDTEGIELDMSAITGLGNELDGLSDQIERKASTEDVESLSATVGSMSGTVETALGEGGTVEKLRSDMDTIQAHISLGTIGEGSSMQPAITLDAEGGSSDGFKNVITNTSMSFMYGDETVAEVNKDELDITRTKVTESMQLGNFMWIPLSDGSLAFKWVEE